MNYDSKLFRYKLRGLLGPVMIAALLFTLFPVFSVPAFSVSCSVKGTITEKGTDAPLEKVKISIVSMRTSTARYEILTDKKGSFYKTGLQNGQYRFSFEKEGYVPVQSSMRLRANDVHELAIQLEKIEVKTSGNSFKLVAAAQKLMKEGKYDEALDSVTQAIEKDPGSFILYYNRAIAYEKKGAQDKAILDYRESLELKPGFLLSLSALGNIFAKKGDFEKAVGYYKKAFDLEITDTLALYNYGACLVNLGKNSEAKTVFEKLVSLDNNYADAYYQMGIIYLGLNENAKAIGSFEKFLEIDPDNENASVAKEILKSLK